MWTRGGVRYVLLLAMENRLYSIKWRRGGVHITILLSSFQRIWRIKRTPLQRGTMPTPLQGGVGIILHWEEETKSRCHTPLWGRDKDYNAYSITTRRIMSSCVLHLSSSWRSASPTPLQIWTMEYAAYSIVYRRMRSKTHTPMQYRWWGVGHILHCGDQDKERVRCLLHCEEEKERRSTLILLGTYNTQTWGGGWISLLLIPLDWFNVGLYIGWIAR